MADVKTPAPKLSDRRMTAAVNARTNLIAEIRRSAGAKAATKALPFICAQLGIPIDLRASETLAQGELPLPANAMPSEQ
jgi:hypothetical protein